MRLLWNAVQGAGHIVAALTSQCRDFHKAWQAGSTVGNGNAAPARPFEGRWQGRWVSETTGHSGKLRCVLWEIGSGKYRACFHATFMGWLRACYCVTLEGREMGADAEGTDGATLELVGEIDVGNFSGGVYRYEGRADQHKMFCRYHCDADQGYFELTRPAG